MGGLEKLLRDLAAAFERRFYLKLHYAVLAALGIVIILISLPREKLIVALLLGAAMFAPASSHRAARTLDDAVQSAPSTHPPRRTVPQTQAPSRLDPEVEAALHKPAIPRRKAPSGIPPSNALVDQITRALAKSTQRLHVNTCPSVGLGASLPQLNVEIVPTSNVNLRDAPAGRVLQTLQKGFSYQVDIVEVWECWIRVRQESELSRSVTGWLNAQYVKFEYDDEFVMPSDVRSHRLNERQLEQDIGSSVYLIVAGAGSDLAAGSAVAVTASMLITNCHVVSGRSPIHVIDGDAFIPSFLVHSKKDYDMCFVKVIEPILSPTRGVRAAKNISSGERVYAIGWPGAQKRSVTHGHIVKLHSGRCNGPFVDAWYIQTTAAIAPGSSGGGLFDENGNLVGITTFAVSRRGQLSYFAIPAEHFWQ
jgi:S1-C subfamily serine protease